LSSGLERGLQPAPQFRDVMIDEGLSPAEVTARFYALGSRGLLVDDAPALRDFQTPYARTAAEVASWSTGAGTDITLGTGVTLANVVSAVRPTMLIGTSTQAGAFTEAIVKDMAAHTERPIIMPLSDPTSKCEALPEDLIQWTGGRALVATGSPFPPVFYGGITHRIAQANNALVFPGLGLGVTVARARRINQPMIAAAADAVAQLSDPTAPEAPLLPPVEDLRTVSAAVAVAVAVAAAKEGLAQVSVDDPVLQVHQAMWRPEYPIIELADR
jgi:malate dehydrogenase (oxaloacetate-decarboxylating)